MASPQLKITFESAIDEWQDLSELLGELEIKGKGLFSFRKMDIIRRMKNAINKGLELAKQNPDMIVWKKES